VDPKSPEEARQPRVAIADRAHERPDASRARMGPVQKLRANQDAERDRKDRADERGELL
jgi:hypothetical protein